MKKYVGLWRNTGWPPLTLLDNVTFGGMSVGLGKIPNSSPIYGLLWRSIWGTYPSWWRLKFWDLPLSIGFDEVTFGEMAVRLGKIPSSLYFFILLESSKPKSLYRGRGWEPIVYIERNFFSSRPMYRGHNSSYFLHISSHFFLFPIYSFIFRISSFPILWSRFTLRKPKINEAKRDMKHVSIAGSVTGIVSIISFLLARNSVENMKEYAGNMKKYIRGKYEEISRKYDENLWDWEKFWALPLYVDYLPLYRQWDIEKFGALPFHVSSGAEKIPGSPPPSNTCGTRGGDMKHGLHFDTFHVFSPEYP